MNDMRHTVLSMVVVSLVCCSTKVDKSYSTDCEVDEDCTLMPLDDVCGGCTTVPVAMSDAEQAAADVKAAQWQCIDIVDCAQSTRPGCDGGTCVAVPLLNADETDQGE
jgi:hypothetical protein